MNRLIFKKFIKFHFFIKKLSGSSYFYLILVVLISLLYAFYVSNIATFQSDWAAFYLFISEAIAHGNIRDYFMPPTPTLSQIVMYILPIYSLFGISYKTFYLVIFFQTFVNVIVLFYLILKLFSFKHTYSKITTFFILLLTLTGPLIKIIDNVMFRKDIPLILLAIYYLYSHNNKKNNFPSVLCTIFLSIQAYGDPFVTYMMLVPLIITNVFYFFFKSKSSLRTLKVSLLSVISIIISMKMRLISAKFLFNLYNETSSFVTIDKLSSNFVTLFKNIDYLLPVSGFLGTQIMSFSNIRFFSNISILVILIIALIYSLRKSITNNNPFLFYIASLPIFSTLIYTFSVRPGADNLTARYHILFVFVFYIVIFYFIENGLRTKFRPKLLLYFLLVIHFIFNASFFCNAIKLQITNFNDYNQLDANINLINLLNKYSLKKGFAGYWDASNNTYYSRNKIAIRPILCDEGKAIPFYWFTFKHWYEPETKVSSSFIYLDKSGPTFTSTCDINILRQEFGVEQEAIEFETSKLLYIWNYDISSKIYKYNFIESNLIK